MSSLQCELRHCRNARPSLLVSPLDSSSVRSCPRPISIAIRHHSCIQAIDLVLTDIDADHVIAGLGHAHAGHQADVTGADDGCSHICKLGRRAKPRNYTEFPEISFRAVPRMCGYGARQPAAAGAVGARSVNFPMKSINSMRDPSVRLRSLQETDSQVPGSRCRPGDRHLAQQV